MKKIICVSLLIIESLISIGQTLQANFTHSIDRDTPMRVHFKDLSQPVGQITAWKWDFGDGSALSTMREPNHLYTMNGEYTVKLVVYRGTEENTYGKKISVSTELKAIFTLDKALGKPPLTVELDGTASTGVIASQTWLIQPETGFEYTSGNKNTLKATVKFTKGTYTIVLAVANSSGFTAKAPAQTVKVNNDPLVDFEWDSPAYLDRVINFRDKTSYPCPNLTTQTWTFPTQTSHSTDPNYTFQSVGTHDVKLCVTDACGASICTTKKVEVKQPIDNLVPSFEFPPEKHIIRKGQTVEFRNWSTPHSEINWWMWGFEQPRDLESDVAVESSASTWYPKSEYRSTVSWKYDKAGSYKVRLYVGKNLSYAAGQPLPILPANYSDQYIVVNETPVLKPSNIDELLLSFQLKSINYDNGKIAMLDHYIVTHEQNAIRRQNIAVQKVESNELVLVGGANFGSPPSTGVLYRAAQLKDNKLIISKSPWTDQIKHSFQIVSDVNINPWTFEPSNEIPASRFEATTDEPMFDIKGDEVIVQQYESGGAYLYYIKKGVSWSASAAIKTRLSSNAKKGKINIDNNRIICHVSEGIIIFEKINGVYDFSKKHLIPGNFLDITFSGDEIVALPVSTCRDYTYSIANFYNKGANGWEGVTQPNGYLYLAIDEDIKENTTDLPKNTKICNGLELTSITMSENFIVVTVILDNQGTQVNRKYVYKRLNSFSFSRTPRYKIDNVNFIEASSPTSNSHLFVPTWYRYAAMEQRIDIYNYDEYCKIDPYIKSSFSIKGTNEEIKAGVIILGDGNAIINSGATISYVGTSITLKPGLIVKPGSSAIFSAVETCDDLFYTR